MFGNTVVAKLGPMVVVDVVPGTVVGGTVVVPGGTVVVAGDPGTVVGAFGSTVVVSVGVDGAFGTTVVVVVDVGAAVFAARGLADGFSGLDRSQESDPSINKANRLSRFNMSRHLNYCRDARQ